MAVVWPSKNNFANGDVLTATNMNNIGDTLNVFNPTSATNGQVWIANGSGSGAYATLASAPWSTVTTSTSTSNTVSLSVTGDNYRQLALWVNSTHGSISMPIWNMNNDTTASWYQYQGIADGTFYGDPNGTPFRFGGTSYTSWQALILLNRVPGSGARWGGTYTTMGGGGSTVNTYGFIINTGTAMTNLTVTTANVTTATYTLLGVAN